MSTHRLLNLITTAVYILAIVVVVLDVFVWRP